MLMHFLNDVDDNGFVNLAPEFRPDFRRKVLRRHHNSVNPAVVFEQRSMTAPARSKDLHEKLNIGG